MKKKILSAISCATTLFGAVGFSACEVTDVLFADYKGQIAELEEKIAAVQTQNEDLQKIITEQQGQIADLQEEKQTLETQAKTLEDVLASYESMILEEVEINMIKIMDNTAIYAEPPFIGFEVYSPIENAVFECVRSDEWGWDGEGTVRKTISSNQKIYWIDYMNHLTGTYSKTYMDLYLKLEDKYVGYAVVEVRGATSMLIGASLIKAVIFSKVDGEYQQISKEQVDALMTKAKELYEGPGFVWG